MTLFSPRTRLGLIGLGLVVHGAAVALSLSVLGPALYSADLLKRRTYVAHAPLAWSFGWCAWALATLTLVLIFMAWADTLEAKAWAWLAVAITLVGGLADWMSEVVWIFLAPTWAERASSDSFYGNVYALWERTYQVLAIGLANFLYCLGGLILTAASWRSNVYPRWFTWLCAIVWTASLGLSWAGFTGRTEWINPMASIALGSFMPWLVLLGFLWLRRGSKQQDAGCAPGAAPRPLR